MWTGLLGILLKLRRIISLELLPLRLVHKALGRREALISLHKFRIRERRAYTASALSGKLLSPYGMTIRGVRFSLHYASRTIGSLGSQKASRRTR
jgi:hypothetical protein